MRGQSWGLPGSLLADSLPLLGSTARAGDAAGARFAQTAVPAGPRFVRTEHNLSCHFQTYLCAPDGAERTLGQGTRKEPALAIALNFSWGVLNVLGILPVRGTDGY